MEWHKLQSVSLDSSLESGDGRSNIDGKPQSESSRLRGLRFFQFAFFEDREFRRVFADSM